MEHFHRAGKTKEFNGQTFEVLEPSILSPSDIEKGDRVFVKTSSGNRYMIRHSESRPGMLKIYNEREEYGNGGWGKGHFLYSDGGAIAATGEKFDFTMYTDVEKGEGTKMNSTTVTGIEIAKGLDGAIAEGEADNAGAVSLADMLKRHVNPRNADDENDPVHNVN